MLQDAMRVVEAEQQRADQRAGALLVPAEARDHAIGGALVLEGAATTVLDLNCDRCCKAYQAEKSVPLDSLLATELEDEDSEDEIILLEGGAVDLDEVATTAFVLDMDTKNLCSEDCKGLCSRCGADLNLGPCTCRPDADPRLAALAQLLDDES